MSRSFSRVLPRTPFPLRRREVLNRQTAYGSSLIYAVDIAGNRLSKTSGSTTSLYCWDLLNRMTSAGSPSPYTSHYRYRADGLRDERRWVAADGTRRSMGPLTLLR